MPRNKIDYSKCVIYKIVCNDFNVKDIYVGHTTDFTKRKSIHKKQCNDKNNKIYKINEIINNNGGWYHWSLIVVEEYNECKNIYKAKERVRYWFEMLSIKNITYKEKFSSKCDLCHNDLIEKNKHKRLNRCLDCTNIIELHYKSRIKFQNNCSCKKGFYGTTAFCNAHRD